MEVTMTEIQLARLLARMEALLQAAEQEIARLRQVLAQAQGHEAD